MSFQRMLMMAAREPRPYLPHPEALVCLYVPRWQDLTDRAVLRDYSGHGRNITIVRGDIRDDYAYRLLGDSSNFAVEDIQDFTYLIKRDLLSNGSGFGLSLIHGHLNYLITETNFNIRPSIWNCGQLASIEFQEGTVYGRRYDYCGQPIAAGSRTQVSAIRLNRRADAVLPTSPLYEKTYYISFWSVTLTDEEIEMAKLFLSTASLEDYMMSRL